MANYSLFSWSLLRFCALISFVISVAVRCGGRVCVGGWGVGCLLNAHLFWSLSVQDAINRH